MDCRYDAWLKMRETHPCEEHSVMGRGQQICDMGGRSVVGHSGGLRERGRKGKELDMTRADKWDHRYREETFEREWPYWGENVVTASFSSSEKWSHLQQGKQHLRKCFCAAGVDWAVACHISTLCFPL